MLLKFIEWYFTVGGLAVLLASAVDFISGMYVGIVVGTGRLERQNQVVQEIEPDETKDSTHWLEIVKWTAVSWLTWVYSVPYSISSTYMWLKRVRKEISKEGRS